MKHPYHIFTATLLAGSVASAFAQEQKDNVLFIICDDLRTQLGCYGAEGMLSPNIDRLAAEGVVFRNSYCNIPVSGASRASLLTGVRPTRNAFEKWNARVDEDGPELVSINHWFQQHGYETIANGKIFHHQDDASMKYWDKVTAGGHFDYKSEENRKAMALKAETGKGRRGLFYEADPDASESDYQDARVAEETIADLKKLAAGGKPFFLAAGFYRPHLPFIVPKAYWDLYDHDKIRVPDNFILKEGNDIPQKAFTNFGELRQYQGIPSKGGLDEETARLMIHGYYAAVSFVDAQIGKVLDALKELGLDRNTSVVLIGDHGWNLGEHSIWCKHCVMNTSLRAPVIISSPKAKKSYPCEELVEFVDLYPTICDLAGISRPETLEGESMLPLLMSEKAASKGYAISRWAEGFTYTDKRWSYTEWWDKEDQVKECMLFDLKKDPDQNYNLAGKKRYRKLISRLSVKLKSGRGSNFDR